MRVETNHRLARRNRQIAQYMFFASFLVPIAGLIIINQQTFSADEELDFFTFMLPLLVLPAAYLFTLIAVRMANLWVRKPRPEEVIREGVKGVSNKSVLYNYYHFPARHVLITPQGVYAMVTRFQDGRFTVINDKWITHRSALGRIFGIFRMDSIGDPCYDAIRAAEHVKAKLASIAPDVEVQPLIVFTDPRAEVNIQGVSVPVVHASSKRSPSLKDFLREAAKSPRPSLTPEQIAAFEEATLPSR